MPLKFLYLITVSKLICWLSANLANNDDLVVLFIAHIVLQTAGEYFSANVKSVVFHLRYIKQV